MKEIINPNQGSNEPQNLPNELEGQNNNSTPQQEEELQLGVVVDSINHKLLYVTESYTDVMCDEIGVKSITKNLDSQAVIITYYHRTAYKDSDFCSTMQQLTSTLIFKLLTSKGVVVKERYKSIIADYLMDNVSYLVDNNQMNFIHERVGFCKHNDFTKGFLASKSIKTPYKSVMRNNEDQLIGPAGDRNVYDKMIQEEIIPNKSLHLPLVLGFVAPLVPIMYDKTACPVLLTNFAGKSSHGKSTSLVLMASIWGKGHVSNTRLSIAKTFTSTQNGFEATVNENFGFPVIYDDYETATNLNIGKLIYSLAQGESKTRCEKDGRVANTFQWRTLIALSGESSIFDKAGNNLGLKPRIVEFKNTKWTASKQNSINITGVVNEHYGFYGEEFVSKLMTVSKEKLNQLYTKCEEKINSLCPPNDNIGDRIQTRLALIMLTALLVKKLMDLDIDVEYITNVLVENEKARQENLDIYQLAKEKLIEFYNKNLTSFVRYERRYEDNIVPASTILGRIYKGAQGDLLAILPEPFEQKIMVEFNDREAILSKWKEEGFLITDEKRYTKKVRIISYAQPPRCYVISFDKLSEELEKYTKEDVIEISQVENEDLRNLCNSTKPKIIQQNGEKYIRLNEVEKDGENFIQMRRKTKTHDSLNPKESQPKQDINNTEISEITYDDNLAVDEIFNSAFDKSEKQNGTE